MSIDVLIKQKMFGSKTMPLDVILGEDLHYGNFENDQLNVGELGDGEFIAYNPKSIGRGFSVIWNEKEKKKIILRLPQPSTTQELTDFYAAISRMVKYWGAKLVVDGNRVSLAAFMAGFQEALEFNEKALKHFSKQILDGESENLMLYSTMFPLTVGRKEAEQFLNDPESYARWLHEKQSMDVYHEGPRFYQDDNGEIIARYFLFDNAPVVLPNQPAVPFGVTDPKTGKPLECHSWRVLLVSQQDAQPVGEIEYSKFLNMIPDGKRTEFDAACFLIEGLSLDELKALAETEN